MKKSMRLLLWCPVVAMLLGGASVRAADVDLTSLVKETQNMVQGDRKLKLVWWTPEEFWAISFGQSPGVGPEQVEQYLEVLRPYTMLIVVDATMGPFGGLQYRPEDSIRSGNRIIDEAGKSYAPLPEDDIDPDTWNLLQMFKPVLASMLGPMGQNMHFLLFPAKDESGAPIASATAKGRLKVTMGDEEFSWRLPLDALLPVKTCPGCGEECKGSWHFCPWCGKSLDEQQ